MAMVGVAFRMKRTRKKSSNGLITTRWTKNLWGYLFYRFYRSIYVVIIFMTVNQLMGYPLNDPLGDRRKAMGFSLIGKSK